MGVHWNFPHTNQHHRFLVAHQISDDISSGQECLFLKRRLVKLYDNLLGDLLGAPHRDTKTYPSLLLSQRHYIRKDIHLERYQETDQVGDFSSDVDLISWRDSKIGSSKFMFLVINDRIGLFLLWIKLWCLNFATREWMSSSAGGST